MEAFDIILKYKSLQDGLRFVMNHNKSNLAPYHNLSHMLTVVKHCYRAMDYMDMLDDKNCELLLVAALFHDFNHSMGRRDDAYNVAQAKIGLENFVKYNTIVEFDLWFLNNILDATQYPYIIKSQDLNSYQAIIRDADLMQISEPDWISHVILGLSEEMHYLLKELMVGERDFLKAMEFHTPYGKMIQKTFGKQVWEDFKKLEKILK